MIAQTLALFLDAYRELNSRKLFWVVLAISLLFAGAFAAVGVNESGLTLLWWQIPAPVNESTFGGRAGFYKLLFIQLGLRVWLTWIATVLALISTANIIPDFVSGGAIELVLSKPIARTRLFLTKLATALTFVAIQVGLFTFAAFLVIGLRGGEWVWGLSIAIPLVLLFFSYIYSISALVGLLTRSSITALLVSILFWFLVFVAQAAENWLLIYRTSHDIAASTLADEGRATADALAHAEADGTPDDADALRAQLADTRERLAAAAADRTWWSRMHALAYGAVSVLPKTSQTMDLLEYRLIESSGLKHVEEPPPGQSPFPTIIHGARVPVRTVMTRVDERLRARSVGWVIGTSLAFEAAVIGIATLTFARRDF